MILQIPSPAVDTLTKLTSEVASQDFKYWVVGLFFTGLAITVYIARWFSARHDAVVKRMNELEDARVADLKEDKALAYRILDNNAVSFKEFTEVIKTVQHLFQK